MDESRWWVEEGREGGREGGSRGPRIINKCSFCSEDHPGVVQLVIDGLIRLERKVARPRRALSH